MAFKKDPRIGMTELVSDFLGRVAQRLPELLLLLPFAWRYFYTTKRRLERQQDQLNAIGKSLVNMNRDLGLIRRVLIRTLSQEQLKEHVEDLSGVRSERS